MLQDEVVFRLHFRYIFHCFVQRVDSKKELFLHGLHVKLLISVFILLRCFYFQSSLIVATISIDISWFSNLL